MHLIDTPNTRARVGLISYFRTPTPRRDPFWTHIRPTLGTEYVVTPASTYPGDPPIGTPKMDHFRPLLGPFGPLRDPSTGRIAVDSGDSGPFWTRLDQLRSGRDPFGQFGQLVDIRDTPNMTISEDPDSLYR